MSGPRLKKGKIVISAQHIHRKAAEFLVFRSHPRDHLGDGSITDKSETQPPGREPCDRWQWLSGRPHDASDGGFMAPPGA